MDGSILREFSKLVRRIADVCHERPRLIDGIVGGVLGAVFFLLIYGITSLDVTYDYWILNGYIEDDIIQHYAGWIAFRESAWAWPLGSMEGLGDGTLTYTDSIPWAAIFFKVMSPFLPTTFQYFGLWVLLCYILQGVAASLLIGCVVERRPVIYLGILLFLLSPIMMERAFRHTALASHWLILFALYALLHSRQNNRISWAYCVLSVLSIGIHPYFLPMIMLILFANVVDLAIRNRTSLPRSILVLCVAIALTIIAGYAIGALGVTRSMQGTTGFGYYSMNLNALINPLSVSITWSSLLPVREQILGNYDGFNYLGLGLLLALFCAGVILLVKKRIISVLRNNISLIVLCAFFTLFAVSNVVTWDDQIMFTYPLPNKFLKLADIFRASGRLFYPVYYLLILLCVYAVSLLKKPWGSVLLALVVVLQIIDLSPALHGKHESLKRETIEEEYNNSSYDRNPIWMKIKDNYRQIKVLDWINVDHYRLAAFGIRTGLTTDINIANRPQKKSSNLSSKYASNYDELASGQPDIESVYITDDEKKVFELLEKTDSISVYDFNGMYLIVSKDNDLLEEKLESIDNRLG